MLKQNGGGIADHEVGGGKTLIMCCAAYEMKRLGLGLLAGVQVGNAQALEVEAGKALVRSVVRPPAARGAAARRSSCAVPPTR